MEKSFCKLVIGVLGGILVGAVLYLSHLLLEGMHPLDRWHYLAIYAGIGSGCGLIVGCFWLFSFLHKSTECDDEQGK